MAILIKTKFPRTIIRLIKKKIDNDEIRTWKYDREGDFTHCNIQWVNHAWFTPIYEENMLVMGIIGRKDRDMTQAEYAIYHGRFVELLLSHFDNRISSIEITPFPSKYDSVDND